MKECNCNSCKIEDALNRELSLLRGVQRGEKLVALARMSGELLAEFGDEVDNAAREYIDVMHASCKPELKHEQVNDVNDLPDPLKALLETLGGEGVEVHVIAPKRTKR